ncbi:MAG: DUF3566 domain-containing protein [Candidatus Actinomarina sp.]|jgi:hypothetical protein|nr:DUF3566 domain-containing protein [Candidatus Actinomarinales bacterium]|tara:strand:+ start:315 stop:917 length:603 start_codon:yes stop_codon:yes gene_type:complete
MVRVNRVRRIIRKIDPWTVLKVTLVLNFIVSLTVVLGLSILWVLLVNAGVPQGLEDIARRLALLDQDASLVGNIETLFTSVVSLAAVYMLTQTALATIGAFFYNLVSDLVGGIEVVVLEESHLETPQKQKINKKTKENQDDKETVLMSFVNSIKKVRENKSEEIEIPKTDLPRPDVPRDIEEPTLMDALKNTENEEDESI